MRFNKILMSSAVVVSAFIGAQAQAAGPTLSDVLKNSGVTVSGHLSGGYNYGLNSTGNENSLDNTIDPEELAGVRVFDRETDSFQLSQAVLNISALPASGFGGFASLMFGEDALVINGSYGDGDEKFALTQGYIQYASGPFTLIGGRYTTLAGAEVIADPANANISRGLLFALAQPFLHTGVRGSWKASDMITGYLGVNNSAVAGAADDTGFVVDADGDLSPEDQQQKTVEVGVATTPTSTTAFSVFYYDGVEGRKEGGEGAPPENLSVSYLDVLGSLQATPALQFVLNYSLADFEDGAEVSGFAGYINFKLSPQLRASFRGEMLEIDPDGGGETEDLESLTLTVGYAPTSNFELLLEGRMDTADSDFFRDGVGTPPVQETAIETASVQARDTVLPNGEKYTDEQSNIAVKAIFKF